MKKITLLFLLFMISFIGLSQVNVPIKFRTTEQCATTPDEEDNELYFFDYWLSKPITVNFNGSVLNMYTDKGVTYLKKNIKTFDKKTDYDNSNNINLEKWTLVASSDSISRYDTIQIIIDYRFKYIQYQIILPTKDVYGENYTSFRKFSSDELASK
ncbi:hypothetical protein M0Q97_10900 [Candidatus Dojkabacteria bacterium]|jgi:hypothetical protein|nr:hypothetical protein [Candidatus Dojkabacteria bacterium]